MFSIRSLTLQSFPRNRGLSWRILRKTDPFLSLERVFKPRAFSFLSDRTAQETLGQKRISPLFEIALVLMCFDHVARFIVNANHSCVNRCDVWPNRLHW